MSEHGLILDFPNIASFRVAPSEQLQSYTESGWRVLAAFPKDDPLSVSTKCGGGVSGSRCQHGHEGYCGNYLTTYQPRRVTTFLLGKTRDEELDDLRDSLEQARSQEYELTRRVEELTRQQEAFEFNLKNAEHRAKSAEAAHEEALKRETECTESRQLLERHLGKVQEAIGTKAYKEIIGT